MSKHTFMAGVVVVLAWSMWGIAKAAEPTKAVSPDARNGDAGSLDIARRVDIMESQIQSLASRLGMTMSTATKLPNAPEASPKATAVELTPAERTAVIEQKLQGLEARLARIEQEHEQLWNATSELQKLRISARLESLGNAVGTLEKKIAVIPMQQKETNASGTVYIENWTGMHQQMRVNGIGYMVPPGRTPFAVPLGPVTTELIGAELPRQWSHWSRNGAAHEMTVAIRL